MRLLVLLLLLPLASGQLTGFDDGPLQLFNLQAGSPPAEHQDMSVAILVGDDVWFATDSIHEHDGYHAFMAAAPEGALVEAKVAGEVYNWTVQNNRTVNGSLELNLDVEPGNMNRLTADYDQFIVGMDMFMAWPKHSAMLYAPTSGMFEVASQNFQMQGNGYALQSGEHGPADRVSGWRDQVSGQTLQTPAAVPCQDEPFLLDPPGGQYQSNTIIRIAADNDLPDEVARVIKLDGAALVAQWQADHDLSQVSLLLEPGAYQLQLGDGCFQAITVTVGPTDRGTVDVEHAVVGDGVYVNMTAMSQGTVLSHYEYDVRLYNDFDLLYMGKLHGHGGGVGFYKGLLEPGYYEMNVFASPQDVNAPGTDTLWRYNFTIEATSWTGAPGTEGSSTYDNERIPAPFALLPLLVWALLRRR